ncbi:MAG TPA: hypothetical protein VMC09_14700 [Anaerolineales bacterium]|nr:hypothetical protein [Anaerolineales bacterium]
MMGKSFRAGLTAAALIAFLASLFLLRTRGASAADDQPPGPDRYTIVTQNYTSYTWWLTGFSDNKVLCTINVDHKGVPTGGEIFDACGQATYLKWASTQSCSPGGSCKGYYLEFINSTPATRKVGVELPPPVVWVTLDGCVPYRSTFRCDSLPTLVLTGEEPLDGQHITSLAGRVDGKPFTCDPVCQVDLVPTDTDGITVEFWAYSSYGDSSVLFQARVRVIPSDDASGHFWYTDVISPQWRGDPLAACSQDWNAFPPVGGVPDWLLTPQRADDLATDIPYEFLAGHLIMEKVVDASTCVDNGLLPNDAASACGMDAARSAVTEWQNRYDSLIFSAARDTGVPARLLKDIFARESQFWPGVTTDQPEAGLGQMTDGGADTTLLWNQPFFEQFCATAMDDASCRKGYANLTASQQDLLRSALVKSVDANCPDCQLGIDLSRAENSVTVFAQTLLANCDQTGMIVHNTYYQTPGESAGYEDLWRFTLVNYNAGPGCLTLAIRDTSSAGDPLDWDHLLTHLTPACQGAVDYVNSMSQSPP